MGHACHAVPVLGHFTGCLFTGGLLLVPFRSSPQFAHLNAMPYFLSGFLPSSCLFSALLYATSGILHPQSLHMSQCPSDSASCLCLQSKPTRRMQGARLPPVQSQCPSQSRTSSDNRKHSGTGRGKGFCPTVDWRKEAGATWMLVSLLDPRGWIRGSCCSLPTASPKKLGSGPGTWTPTATHIPQDWATRAAGGASVSLL